MGQIGARALPNLSFSYDLYSLDPLNHAVLRKNFIRGNICCFVNEFGDREILFRCPVWMPFGNWARTSVGVLFDQLTFYRLTLRTPQSVAAENLFLHPGPTLTILRMAR